MKFSLISALTKSSRGIGFKNGLPWSGTPEGKLDMNYFTKTTESHIVIMGRNTWESIPSKFRPLPRRHNIVISKTLTSSDVIGADIYKNLDLALSDLQNKQTPTNSSKSVFVIGGEMLYREAIQSSQCEKIYLTEIDDTLKPYECDTYFPELPSHFKLPLASVENTNVKFQIFENILDLQSQEIRYLNLLKEILEKGEKRSDRTGTGTLAIFGTQLRFSLTDSLGNFVIPLMTTKNTFFRGIVEELLFFLRGDHDNRKLQAKKVHIWDGNTSREYLDKYGKQNIATHDLGLAYGVQWRAAGAKLESIDTDYRGKGLDQLAEVINLLKTDPNSRRIIINAWNVPQLQDMALVPCHMLYQFDVTVDGTLNCMMTQRSCDIFLGVPFNIASTALLVHILAKTTNLKPGEIIISMGNAHIYNNHIEQVKKQLTRNPYRFPNLNIKKSLSNISDIENLTFEDFELVGYYCHPGIKAPMAV